MAPVVSLRISPKNKTLYCTLLARECVPCCVTLIVRFSSLLYFCVREMWNKMFGAIRPAEFTTPRQSRRVSAIEDQKRVIVAVTAQKKLWPEKSDRDEV